MLNRVDVQGRFTADPVLKTTQNQDIFTVFTIACDRDYGERDADFFNCTAWSGAAEFICKHFKKGKMAVISGRLQNRKWNDKDGNKRMTNEIKVENIYFCDGKKQDFEELENDEEMPFT